MATAQNRAASGSRLPLLALGALGVVYGDIGTSPLYALRESFVGTTHELEITRINVLGILSLIFWALTIVITIKYLLFVMRADNDGEGGIMALTSLVSRAARGPRRRRILILLGLFGTALLYGDGMITPAISVLSAVEGTTVAAPGLHRWVVPIAAIILVGLFAIQRWGTGSIGSIFGPVMVAWFVVIATLGAVQIVQEPGVLTALNPWHGVRLFMQSPMKAFLALGSVFLVVTGGEALYADMGHFGRRAIQVGWFGLVLPGLLLNYFGQGALLLAEPGAIENPFYRLAPDWGLYPMVVLATMATAIASQALISGVFSLSMQSTQLGYNPRLRVVHTSEFRIGQIYVPAVNWMLMVACVGLVLGFRSSSRLAAAYGVAVTTTMVITTLLFFVVARDRFRWRLASAILVCGAFLVVDLGFFSANIFKVPAGGWFPIVVAAIIFTVMTTWRTGRKLLRRLVPLRLPLREFLQGLSDTGPPQRVTGTAVYLFGAPGFTPPALVENLRHNAVLHESVLVVSVVTDDVPRVTVDRRLDIESLGDGFHEIVIHYGYMEKPDVPKALQCRAVRELGIALDRATYFLGREALIVTGRAGMAMWREHLFAFLYRNATPAANYFNLPLEQTIEILPHLEF